MIVCFYVFIQLEENILCLEFRYIDSFDSYGHFSEPTNIMVHISVNCNMLAI